MSPAIAFVSETHDGNSSRASSCGEDSGSEPSIPGSNPHCPSPAQLSYRYSPRLDEDDGLVFSRATAAARAWSEDSQDVASTEDEDEDRRLEAEALTLAGAQSDSTAMAKKGIKKVNDLAVATGGKANSGPVNRLADSTQWTTNVEKWQLQDAENVLTPRGSKRNSTKYSTSKKQPSVAMTQTPRVLLKPLVPTTSSLHARSIQHAELNAAPSVVIEMDPLVHHTRPQLPLSTSFKSTAMRMMERLPLLQPQPSIQNDPEWAFRGLNLSETTPDLKGEFVSLAELSYPVILTYVLEYLPGIVSMTLVGHMDSPKTKEYVDGVSLSAMFMNLTALAFGFGLATALDTLCSQAFGAGKPMKMGIYFQCGVLVLGLTLIPVFLLNWYTEQFLLWMGQPGEVAALAGRFSRLVLPGIPFLYAYELFKKLLQAQNVVTPMVYIAVLSNVVNVVLGVYLTWYTSLGYDGAAIARTVANVVLPVALVPLFWWRPEIMNEWWPGWKLSQAMRYLKTFLTLGIPGMFMMVLEWWAFEIMAAFVGLLPQSVVAMSVHSVLSNVSVLTFNVFLGIGVATNIRVGTYVGRNQPEHAKLASALGMVLSMLVSVALAVVILAARNVLPMVFINDATSITLAAHAILVLIPYQMLDSLNSVMQGVFRGVGHQKLAACINLCGYFVVGLPFGIFLAFRCGYGVEGLWLGLTSGIGVGVALSMVKIYNANWEELADAARVRTS